MRIRKQYFDEDLAEDVRSVLDAAALLGIAEFRVFQIAYRAWFGEDTDEVTIERYFTPYMFQDAVPPWVRHFTARVLDADRQGVLDPAQFGIRRRAATAGQIHRGRMFALILVGSLATLWLLAEIAAVGGCMFPPCY